jgi:alpha-L-rhamnosidase
LLAGLSLKLKVTAGDKIVISHAEVMDKAGNFYTDNLRDAKCINTFILKGGAEETFEPQFTWQGFPLHPD